MPVSGEFTTSERLEQQRLDIQRVTELRQVGHDHGLEMERQRNVAIAGCVELENVLNAYKLEAAPDRRAIVEELAMVRAKLDHEISLRLQREGIVT